MKQAYRNYYRILGIAAIMAVSFLCMLYFGRGKLSLSQDETFSYGSANDERGPFIEIEDRTWHGSELFWDYLNVDEAHRFNYRQVVKNQSEDVHPPLYYIVLHTICSIFYKKQFSVWMGLGINLVCILLVIPILYRCALLLFGKDAGHKAYVICLAYALSLGTMDMYLFIRMYALMQLLAVLLLYIHLRALKKNDFGLRFYLPLCLTAFAGVMTQYYFLILLFLAGAGICCILLLQRRWKQIFAYAISMGLTGAVSVKCYNSMLWHIFGSYRGTEAQHNLFDFQNYAQGLFTVFGIISRSLFGGLLWIICLIFIVCVLWDIVKKGRQGGSDAVCFAYILVIAAGYCMAVCKVAPYLAGRYYTPVYPMLLLLGTGALYYVLERVIPGKALLSGILAVLFVVPLCLRLGGGIMENERLSSVALAEEYGSFPCVYAMGSSEGLTRDSVKENFPELVEFDAVYYVYNDAPAPIEDDVINTADTLVVYIDSENDTDVVREWLQAGNSSLEVWEPLYQGRNARVWLVSDR